MTAKTAVTYARPILNFCAGGNVKRDDMYGFGAPCDAAVQGDRGRERWVEIGSSGLDCQKEGQVPRYARKMGRLGPQGRGVD